MNNQAYRIPALAKMDRSAQVVYLEQWVRDHRQADEIEVEDEPLSRAERAEIAKFNRQMEKVGLVLIPIAFLLGAICFVVNLGRAVGWWA